MIYPSERFAGGLPVTYSEGWFWHIHSVAGKDFNMKAQSHTVSTLVSPVDSVVLC